MYIESDALHLMKSVEVQGSQEHWCVRYSCRAPVLLSDSVEVLIVGKHADFFDAFVKYLSCAAVNFSRARLV